MYRETNFRKQKEENDERVFSKAIKAGKRTYFMDVRATRSNDYFISITESRKQTHDDGGVSFDRHQIFLYKEDFTKFSQGLQEVVDYIKQHKPDFFEQSAEAEIDEEFERL